MGMDVYGRSPTSETGNYFRRNVWGWRPLADYCLEVFPQLTDKCRYWHSNDGDGLDKAHSIRLAKAIEAAVKDGSAEAYIKWRDARVAALPRKECEFCHGKGIRTDKVGKLHHQPEKLIEDKEHPRYGQYGWCNACDGRGSVEAWDASYHLELNDLQEFAAFLRDSGGFEIR